MKLASLLRDLRMPGYHRAVMVRRTIAVTLLLVAGTSLLFDARSADPPVAVFARDVEAGAVLTEADVALRRLPPSVVPANALGSTELAVGQVLAAGASANEVIASTRLVGPDLQASLLGNDANPHDFTMVPVTLAEPELLPMLHHGARVDIVAPGPRVIARGGKVVTTNEHGSILVLLQSADAANVAAASLTDPLTVVLTTH
ncbi:hypothetical protein BJP08_06835 [Corynebacterium sp. NML140438]|uniref:SAF domain-containing protein n=1 Tax=Corynebacterium sp. NML140438 TaxID=1906334 RepID=UPI0008FB5A6D|nr:SAF domain-containing protein [Corynebacterium sp. NML140438]OIR41471.1 hypothetical protein BJP08_06835 [Corynebacterium sp. NML140438]